MDRSPASGERNALRGYRWQYDQLASIVYDSLLDGAFQSLRLTDPEAGKVDDLVLITGNERAGHQFKSEEPPEMITFNDIVKPRKTRSGKHAPSWLKALGDGWLSLKGSRTTATVSLVTNQLPSVSDRLPLASADDGNPQRSFAEFSSQVLMPAARSNARYTANSDGTGRTLRLASSNTNRRGPQYGRERRNSNTAASTRAGI